jgi:hypothetical protein
MILIPKDFSKTLEVFFVKRILAIKQVEIFDYGIYIMDLGFSVKQFVFVLVFSIAVE